MDNIFVSINANFHKLFTSGSLSFRWSSNTDTATFTGRYWRCAGLMSVSSPNKPTSWRSRSYHSWARFHRRLSFLARKQWDILKIKFSQSISQNIIRNCTWKRYLSQRQHWYLSSLAANIGCCMSWPSVMNFCSTSLPIQCLQHRIRTLMDDWMWIPQKLYPSLNFLFSNK